MLHAFLADVVDVGKTQQVTCGGAGRIIALERLFEINPGNFQCLNFFRQIRIDLTLDINEALARFFFQKSLQVLVGHAQNLGHLREFFSLVVFELTRIQPDGLDRRADGQWFAIAILDLSAIGRHVDNADVLQVALVLQKFLVKHL